MKVNKPTNAVEAARVMLDVLAKGFDVHTARREAMIDSLPLEEKNKIITCCHRSASDARNALNNMLDHIEPESQEQNATVSGFSTMKVSLIAERSRMNFFPAAFGGAFVRGQNGLYNFMSKYSSNYNGGSWEFFTCANGAYFAAPDENEYELSLPNYFTETVSAKVAGIISMFYVYSDLIAIAHSRDYHNLQEYLTKHYYLLREFVNTLSAEDYLLVMRAID